VFLVSVMGAPNCL